MTCGNFGGGVTNPRADPAAYRIAHFRFPSAKLGRDIPQDVCGGLVVVVVVDVRSRQTRPCSSSPSLPSRKPLTTTLTFFLPFLFLPVPQSYIVVEVCWLLSSRTTTIKPRHLQLLTDRYSSSFLDKLDRRSAIEFVVGATPRPGTNSHAATRQDDRARSEAAAGTSHVKTKLSRRR